MTDDCTSNIVIWRHIAIVFFLWRFVLLQLTGSNFLSLSMQRTWMASTSRHRRVTWSARAAVRLTTGHLTRCITTAPVAHSSTRSRRHDCTSRSPAIDAAGRTLSLQVSGYMDNMWFLIMGICLLLVWLFCFHDIIIAACWVVTLFFVCFMSYMTLLPL